jgi:alkylation response protein AidB-like acyl-CoA dehydrogenase
MATSDMSMHLLHEVERLRPLIQENSASAEANRQLSSAVYDAIYAAGLFTMLAPKAHRRLELHPVESMHVREAVARIDAAAVWNLVMNQAVAQYAAWLPAAGVQELFHDGPPTVAGALNPPAAATRAEGGWRITGQCPFGSGCHNAQWQAMPAIEMDGDHPKVDPATRQPVAAFGVFLPRTAATILDTWHTMGMRGTGSTDYAVQDLFVLDHLTVPVAPLTHPAPGFAGPLFRIWPWTAILGEATVSVGVAAAAVDEAVQLCRTKTPAYNATPLREQQLAQLQMGKGQGEGGSVTGHPPSCGRSGMRRRGQEQRVVVTRRQDSPASGGVICSGGGCRSRPLRERYGRDILLPRKATVRTPLP